MRILIVDDEGCKHSKVAHLVRKSDILKGNVIIETALALSDARSMLKEKFFDFLILDLNISDELGDNLSTTAGSEFIDEILEVDGIKKPANIVILSSNEESKSQFKQELGKKGFELLNFNPTHTDWEEKLLSKLEYAMVCFEQRNAWNNNYDVCIVTAVDVEMDQLKRLWPSWKEIDYPNDSTKYYSTSFRDKSQVTTVAIMLSYFCVIL